MKKNILGLIVLISLVGCGYLYTAQSVNDTAEAPIVNKYMDKNNLPKGIGKSLHHVSQMWTNNGTLEYTDELYKNMVADADIIKANNPNKTTSANPSLIWEELGPNNVGGRTRSILVDKDNPQRLYAAGVTGGVYISNNGGNFWEPYAFNEELGVLSVGKITKTVGGTFFISTSEPRNGFGGDFGFVPGVGIYRISDWNAAPELLTVTEDWDVINEMAAHPTDDNKIFALVESGGGSVQVSNDNGNTWNAIDVLNGQTGYDISFSADNDIYITAGNKIYKSTDGGSSFVDLDDPLLIQSTGARRLVATSPTNNNIVYTVMTQGGALEKVAKSTDAGQSWTQIAPGGTTFLDIFGSNNQAWYDACLIVDPANEDRIFVGGVTLWSYSDEDGWTQLDNFNDNALNPYYVHADKHTFTFDPSNPSKLYIGTDGGIFKTENAHALNPTFYAQNFGYNVTQFYSVGASRDGRVVGGTQDNSTPYMDYSGNTLQESQVLFGGDGTYAEISHIVPNMIFAGSQNNNMVRSNNNGDSFSAFTDYTSACDGDVVATDAAFVTDKSLFISPFLLWENVEEYWEAEDSILESSTILDKDAVLKRLRRANYIMGFCNKAVMSCTDNNIDVLDPGGIVTFTEIAATSSTCTAGTAASPPTAFAVDKSGKYILVGFPGGAIRRVVVNWDNPDYPNGAEMIDDGAGGSRLQNFEEYVLGLGTVSSSGSSASPFNWNESFIYGTDPFDGGAAVEPWGSNYISGINFDPDDNTRAVLSVSSFSTSIEKVYYSENATSLVPTWQPLPGLPTGIPVYEVVLAANSVDGDQYAYAATELGVWGYNFSTNTWTEENEGIGRVRTFRIRQELLKKANCMAVYIGTHGRGIHRSVNQMNYCNTDLTVTQPGTGIPQVEDASSTLNVNIYPNPVTANSKVDFELGYSSDVTLNILSLDGRTVLTESLGALGEGKHFYNINASTLSVGNYIVNIVTEQEIVNSKFTVSK